MYDFYGIIPFSSQIEILSITTSLQGATRGALGRGMTTPNFSTAANFTAIRIGYIIRFIYI